jgi:hypothetical protein
VLPENSTEDFAEPSSRIRHTLWYVDRVLFHLRWRRRARAERAGNARQRHVPERWSASCSLPGPTFCRFVYGHCCRKVVKRLADGHEWTYELKCISAGDVRHFTCERGPPPGKLRALRHRRTRAAGFWTIATPGLQGHLQARTTIRRIRTRTADPASESASPWAFEPIRGE